jgi:hypothetical protein
MHMVPMKGCVLDWSSYRVAFSYYTALPYAVSSLGLVGSGATGGGGRHELLLDAPVHLHATLLGRRARLLNPSRTIRSHLPLIHASLSAISFQTCWWQTKTDVRGSLWVPLNQCGAASVQRVE